MCANENLERETEKEKEKRAELHAQNRKKKTANARGLKYDWHSKTKMFNLTNMTILLCVQRQKGAIWFIVVLVFFVTFSLLYYNFLHAWILIVYLLFIVCSSQLILLAVSYFNHICYICCGIFPIYNIQFRQNGYEDEKTEFRHTNSDSL